jgi:dihydroorotate dehydrogenase electron transfer subunit
MKQEIAPVITNSEVMSGPRLIWLEAPEIAAIAQPGQFVMVRCGEDTILRRPLSIHRVDGKNIALLFSVVGKGTYWLSQQKAGDTIDIFGPLGSGYSIQSSSQKLLLLAGGVGIAPLYFLAQEARGIERSVTILHGASTISHLYPEDMPRGIKIDIVTEDGGKGQKGLVTDLIPKYIAEADQFFACGPLPMYKTMAQMPELKGKPVQISLEIMMGCGVGVCYGCTIKTRSGLKQVCKDGPVFELEDIIWEEIKLF